MLPVRSIILSMLAAAAAAPTSASADEFDTVNVTASSSIAYDSNIFRLSDSTPVPPSLGSSRKSDIITSASIGLKINKPYAQQRFQLDLAETAYRYNNFSFLDFETLNYRGAWLWHLTPRVSGVLAADRKRTLVPFQDAAARTRVFQQALRTVENRRFELDGWVSGPWHVLAGASQISVEDSRIVTGEQAYSAVTQEAGLKYLAGSTSSVSLVYRRLDGDYQESRLDPINFFDNRFKEDQAELSARWVPTGKSTFTGRVAWLDRTHPNIPQRDFDGLAGDLEYAWVPTGKLRFSIAVRRNLGTFWDRLLSSYRTADSIVFSTRWAASAHAEMGGNIQFLKANYKGALAAFPGPARRDEEYRAGVYGTWTPWRNLVLRASLDHYARTSNFAGFDFDSTVASLVASLTF